MIVGLLPGTEELRQIELAGDASLGYVDVVSLSVVQLTAGFLSVGLVRPWGEKLFGRRIPVAPILIVATLGGLAVVWLFDVSMLGHLMAGQRPDGGLVSGAPLVLMIACYAPILLWGPLELVAAVGYWLRRRAPNPARGARLSGPGRMNGHCSGEGGLPGKTAMSSFHDNHGNLSTTTGAVPINYRFCRR